jgi:hypothetical protein
MPGGSGTSSGIGGDVAVRHPRRRGGSPVVCLWKIHIDFDGKVYSMRQAE